MALQWAMELLNTILVPWVNNKDQALSIGPTIVNRQASISPLIMVEACKGRQKQPRAPRQVVMKAASYNTKSPQEAAK